ncbi:helix-hairpin-helix domain-containing protein [Hydrogenoanaerobacterium sp.]|uniref:ComEA family DNA-binding protein n=1 Tax=Hydrogenoanaerobacterium sp. TaxID=2953763 RepID=UPI00289C2D0A|nr:helix-hairpin-helix domain-containing protein [Hydrogenoanaerobacterium sp.]
MKEDFFSVNFLIVLALVLSIGLVAYNAFMMPEYTPAAVSYLPEEISSAANSSASSTADVDSAVQKNLDAQINLNTATAEELQTISGIGPAMAKKLLQYRDKVGVITDLNELMNVDGIGEATYNKIAPHLVLD